MKTSDFRNMKNFIVLHWPPSSQCPKAIVHPTDMHHLKDLPFTMWHQIPDEFFRDIEEFLHDWAKSIVFCRPKRTKPY